ncbi:alpha/beta hydrolase fold domain-containing protein [Actinomadura madurae]|uniref:alpha/beta hydrolase fold domain-containing protein n=1 Tax=Actinomadura madurae TaxID=1993 RepID=UPI0035564338
MVVYVHGGGFVGGGLDVADEVARDLAVRTGAVVVSATYRRAPEHRFPAAHDDVYAALRWTAAPSPSTEAIPRASRWRETPPAAISRPERRCARSRTPCR